MSDNAAEASRMLSESSLINEWTEEERLIFATRAQAEATLALAYEQRTANLIAMWSKPSTSVGNVTWGIGEETAGQFLQEIIERLGVKL
jgi:hypothetical protein